MGIVRLLLFINRKVMKNKEEKRMFEKIIGNDAVKEILESSINHETTSHSYLFVGIEGVGKKLLATEFAREVLCLNKEKGGHCKSCLEFESNNHPDFMCLEPSGNVIKIEQIRSLQKKIPERPIISNRKVYIIDKADTMTTEAQNCLLKTLEEPPQFATIILIGSNESAFLSTIRSRCMVLHFQPIQDEKIKQYMEEKFSMNYIQQSHLAMFQGSIGKAILLKDKHVQYQEIEKLIKDLPHKDLLMLLSLAEPLYKNKEEIDEILEYINILLLGHAKENYLYTNCIKIVENTKKRLKQNANYDMCIDNLVFNMWEEFN